MIDSPPRLSSFPPGQASLGRVPANGGFRVCAAFRRINFAGGQPSCTRRSSDRMTILDLNKAMKIMRHRYLLILALGAITCASVTLPAMLAATPTSVSQDGNPTAAETNPFFAESTLPFHAPPFDRIKDSDYQPALEEGMKRQLVEVEAIANNTEAPTFANTVEAMERTGALLNRVSRVFFGLTQANTNPALQKIQSEEAP